MQISKILLTVGILVALLPHLGFPLFIKNLLFLLLGLVLIYLSLYLYKIHKKDNKDKKINLENFSENLDFFEKDKLN